MGARLDLDRTDDEQALIRHVRAAGARLVVVATDERRGMPVQQLLHCKVAGIDVVDHLTFWERETRSIDPDAVQPGWLVYSHGFRRHALSDAVRRLVDIVASLLLLVFVLPVLMAAAIALKAEGGGPIVVGDERVGRSGASFRQLAFRTARPGWASAVGEIMRRFRVETLPLLVNVLKGDISFIGPAAEPPHIVEENAKRVAFYRERHAVKPGLTGWAQVNRRRASARGAARVTLSYDLYYVKNRTLWLDAVIMARAAWGVCFPRSPR
jgi:lipopolysaccharide/colanic/teichoic acid biosynthesis glycosyltransferase